MTRFQSLRIACLALFSCLPVGFLGCSSDDGHGPTIGAPTTPVVISEGGSAPSGGSGNPNGASAGMVSGGGAAGTINTGTSGGTNPIGTGGSSGGSDPFGTGTNTGGSDPFGTSDPFAGSTSISGTANSFSGSSF
jgi:hypothetical protein